MVYECKIQYGYKLLSTQFFCKSCWGLEIFSCRFVRRSVYMFSGNMIMSSYHVGRNSLGWMIS